MNAVARGQESELVTRVRAHLGTDPRELPSTSLELPITERPNVQLALDAVLPEAEVLGVSTGHPGVLMVGLSGLLGGPSPMGAVELGPVSYSDVQLGDGRAVRCISTGLVLAHYDGSPLVLLVFESGRPFGPSALRLEGVCVREGAVSALLADLRAAMRERNVYRGQVISLHGGEDRTAVHVRFHHLPSIARDAVVLADEVMERLERHALGVTKQAERLRATGRPLKRGVLLHGPPGTGKTLTVSYVLGAMPGRTTVLLTGRNLGLIEPAVTLARELTPATVVLEDVDLVAAERTMPMGDNGVLFELLNQMEGLDADADLLFLLTTNRADLIEPALAARPGRIDLALEIPLPDAAARARLVRLYAEGIPLDPAGEADLVARTDGLTGAFIKELMRQAALRAALADRAPTGADATAALDELLRERSTLTRRLLGQGGDGSQAAPGQPAFPAMLHSFGALGLPVPPDQE